MGASTFVRSLLAIGALAAGAPLAVGQVVYSNDFELDTSGFTAGGSLASLDRASLPTDSAGIGSSNQSTWLGKLGSGVAKSDAQDETATLSLTGLTPGQTYQVNFDLLIGSSWDGAAGSPYGADLWRLTADGIPLVDTSFSNLTQGVNAGAYSPQRYTDTFYTSPGASADDVAPMTGADQHFATADTQYAQDYAIYYFGHGAGNPILTFLAGGATADLQFARYGSATDSADEYWALDNVSVQAVGNTQPPPAAVPLPAALPAGLGMLGALALRRAMRRRAQSAL